jgi:hypothetical protein
VVSAFIAARRHAGPSIAASSNASELRACNGADVGG